MNFHSTFRRQPRILLAEDNTINRRVALLQLKKLGHEADTAVNGLEAVEAVKNRSYDIILMDCHMPVMDGLEAAKHIRREFPALPVRIIALTADTVAEAGKKCLAAGMDACISKPVRLCDLETALAFREQEEVACTPERGRM